MHAPRQAAHQAADSGAHSHLPLACAGLDARAAAIVMRTVRNIVNTGRTIVCTIHQPSIDIFESFDELLLLKRGGQTIYAGQYLPPAHPSVMGCTYATCLNFADDAEGLLTCDIFLMGALRLSPAA